MSKRLIQSKLSFHSYQPTHKNDKVTKPYLKRKLSDGLIEKSIGDPENKTRKMSYASVVSHSSTHKNRNSSAPKRTVNNAHSNMEEKWPMKNEIERSTSTDAGHSSTSASSGEYRRSLSDGPQRRSDDGQDNDTSSGLQGSSLHMTDTGSELHHKQLQDNSEGTSQGYIQKRIEKDKPKSEDSHFWRGVPLNTLKRAPECYKDMSLPPLKPSVDHKIFFNVQHDGWRNELPTPFNDGRQDIWDDAYTYVYMPYSEQSKFKENDDICCRWKKIKEALGQKITGSFELEVAILSYNSHYRGRWNFDALHLFFEISEEGSEMKSEFFLDILPKMQQLALQLPHLCPKALPILKQRKNMKITLSQQQIACLLANAFFCTFPRRNFKVKNGQLPDINFSNLFSDSHSTRKFQKFRCLINYFKRVITNMPRGTVTYARQFVYSEPNFWSKISKKFTNLHASTSGTIEDDGRGMLQADFANKYVGGGVLGHGLVQEEIRFLICPEMIISRLFTEVLTDYEVLIMTGCERFSNYEGYSESFKFSGDHEDETERDDWGRRCTEVVAMDALVINRGYKTQFEHDKLLRELNKAYCAFKGNLFTSSLPAVCTGNWGCGAFGGDKQLKALIQMMAASAADRDICYFTFGDATVCDQLGDIYQIIKDNELTISNVFGLIKEYTASLNNNTGPDISLFQFFADMMDTTNVDSKINRPNDDNDSSMDSEIFHSEEDYKASTP